MKKFLASAIALALVMSTSVTAFAANSDTNDGTAGTNITVNGEYQAAEAPAEKISVDIAWDNMDFTYTGASKGEWNPKNHAYENAKDGAWAPKDGTAPKITVTNHSNADVKASFAFTGSVDGLNGTFTGLTDGAFVIDTADGTTTDNAPKKETSLSISGSEIAENKQIGTVTVTVKSAISNIEALQEAVNAGGTVTLDKDVLTNQSLNVPYDKEVVLDLNGHTWTGTDSKVICINGTATVKNGTVSGGDYATIINYGKLTATDLTVRCTQTACFSFPNSIANFENCMLYSKNFYAIYNNRAKAELVDCTVSSDWSRHYAIGLFSGGDATSVLTIGGSTTVNGYIVTEADSLPSEIVVESGSNFDPTQHYDSESCTLKNNNNGTYTIQQK